MSEKTYRIVSAIYQGGGEQSRHDSLREAERELQRHDRDVAHLNRNGGACYHDCRIEVSRDGGSTWRGIDE